MPSNLELRIGRSRKNEEAEVDVIKYQLGEEGAPTGAAYRDSKKTPPSRKIIHKCLDDDQRFF